METPEGKLFASTVKEAKEYCEKEALKEAKEFNTVVGRIQGSEKFTLLSNGKKWIVYDKE